MNVLSEVENDSEILCCRWCRGGQTALPQRSTHEELWAPSQAAFLLFESGVYVAPVT